jgi:hypothetical protein
VLQAVVVLVIIIISLLVTVVSLVMKQVGHIFSFFPLFQCCGSGTIWPGWIRIRTVTARTKGFGSGSGLNHYEYTTLVSGFIFIILKIFVY